MGENVRIVILVALDGDRGRRRRCCEREALRDKEREGTRCQRTEHSLGENVRIVRLDALDSGKGHRCQWGGREALRDKEGEGTRCQETKHSVGENVRIVIMALLTATGVAVVDAAEEKLFETKWGRGRDVKGRNILWVRM